MPTTELGRRFYALRNRGFAPRRAGMTAAADTLFAFYDLGIAPVSFDFLWFLVGADLARRRANLSKVHVVIVPGPHEGFRDENPAYDAAIDLPMRHARVRNILLPACSLLPATASVTLAGTREEAAELAAIAAQQVYPPRYTPAMPRHEGPRPILDLARRESNEIAVLRAPPYPREAVERWLAPRCGGRRLVTITLRQHAYLPERNSNLAAWTAVARHIEKHGFFPVVIPDTEQPAPLMKEPLPGAVAYPEAAWHLGLRAAIYERAHLNLGVNNGPMGLCWLDAQTRYLIFNILVGDAPQVSKEYMEHLGFTIGESLPFADPFQRWVWQADDEDIIMREFDAMVARIDGNAATSRTDSLLSKSP